MTTLNEREKSFENKFANDQPLQFNVEARCSKLVGLWAASEMGLGDDSIKSSYAKEVVESNLEEAGYDDVLHKIRTDFEKKGLDISDHIINEQINKAHAEAKKQIMEES